MHIYTKNVFQYHWTAFARYSAVVFAGWLSLTGCTVKYSHIRVTDSTYIDIPQKHWSWIDWYAERDYSLAHDHEPIIGVTYVFDLCHTDTIQDSGCGIFLSNRYAPRWVPEYIKALIPCTDSTASLTGVLNDKTDRILFFGKHTRTQSLTIIHFDTCGKPSFEMPEPKSRGTAFYKVMVIPNKQADDESQCKVMGYYGVPRSKRHIYDKMFEIKSIQDTTIQLYPSRPLFYKGVVDTVQKIYDQYD